MITKSKKNPRAGLFTLPTPVHPFIAPDETLTVRYTFSVAFMEWLLENFHPVNRPLSKNRMAAIIADIENGDWNPNSGNLVKFDTTGNIIDGQTRMYAHVALGRAMVSSVYYGLQPEAINFQDIVRPRKASANAVILESRLNGTRPTEAQFAFRDLQMQVAKWYVAGIKWMRGIPGARRTLSHMELNNAVRQAKTQIDFVLGNGMTENKFGTRPGFLSALAIYYTKAPAKALAFHSKMVSDPTKENGSPIHELREYLSRPSCGGSQPIYDHFNTVAAINAFHLGKNVDAFANNALRTSWAM